MENLSLLVLHEAFGEGCPGGSTRVFHETAIRLARAGHRVTAICQTFPPGSGVPDDGVEYLRYEDIPGGELKRFLHRRNATRQAFAEAIGKNGPPDAVVAHSGLAALGLPRELSELNAPMVYYFHSPWHLEYEANVGLDSTRGPGERMRVFLASTLRRKIEAKTIRTARGIATLSHSMWELAAATHPFIRKKPSKVIHGGADHTVFHPDENGKETRKTRKRFNIPDNAFVIISSRRMVPRTGLDNLLAAFAESATKLPKESVLVLSGDGPLKKDLSLTAAKMSVGDKVVFTGHVPETDLAALYRASDLFVMPSRQLEGFGLSTVEAMASGIPALGTNIGGTAEVLGKVSKELLIPGVSSDAIAAKLVDFSNRADLKEWGKRCLDAAKTHFTWEAHTDSLLEFIQETIARQREVKTTR